MKTSIRYFSVSCFIMAFTFLLTACAVKKDIALDTSEPEAVKQLALKGIALMEKQQYTSARKVFAEGLRNDPTSCSLNTLNGLSYQMQGRENNLALLGKAVVGYNVATKYCPNDPWPYYYRAVASLQTKHYLAADKNFKQAAELMKDLKNPPPLSDLYRAFLYSAYRSGQIADGQIALAELQKLEPNSPLIKPLKSLYASLDKKKVAAKDNKAPDDEKKDTNPHNQLYVDAVLILSREISTEKRGINILDGLSLTSTAGVTGSKDQFQPSTNTWSWTSTVNDVTYDLDIFNNISEQDQILARPTIMAQDGEEAKYFVGNDLYLGLSGSDYSSFEEIPLGLTLNVTPKFNDDGTIQLTADIEREMLTATDEEAAGFDSSTESVKQSSSSTITLAYDQTAVFGTLSEATEGESRNKTPLLSALPALGNLFKRKERERTSTQLIILMTPRRYVSFDSEQIRPGTKALRNYYLGLVSPSTNLIQVIKWLRILDIYYRPERLAPSLYSKRTFDKALTTEYTIENGQPRDLQNMLKSSARYVDDYHIH